jgi:hypothetical protein
MFLKTWVKPTIDRHYLVGIINIKDCTQKKTKTKKRKPAVFRAGHSKHGTITTLVQNASVHLGNDRTNW